MYIKQNVLWKIRVITVFITILEQNRQNSCQSSIKPIEANVKNNFTSHIDKKIFLTFLKKQYYTENTVYFERNMKYPFCTLSVFKAMTLV